jgi:chromosome partitioning protein
MTTAMDRTMTASQRLTAALALQERILALQEFVVQRCNRPIVTVASGKGGIGKSTIAREIAYVLDAVAVDLDWDGGNFTTLFGYDIGASTTVPLLDALESGMPPRPVKMARRPDFIPGHTEFALNQPTPDMMKNSLIAWNASYGRALSVDTHPGGGDDATRGAMAAADMVLMPVELGTAELNALEQDLISYDGYPLLLVINKTPRSPSARLLDRLILLAKAVGVPIAETNIRNHPWLSTRTRRTVVTASPAPWALPTILFVEDIVNLGEEVARRVAA